MSGDAAFLRPKKNFGRHFSLHARASMASFSRLGALPAALPRSTGLFTLVNSQGSIRTFLSKSAAGEIIRDGLPPAHGLYDPMMEHGSCGTG